MVAEDNKEVEKKGDGKGANHIDEEELHDRTGPGGINEPIDP